MRKAILISGGFYIILAAWIVVPVSRVFSLYQQFNANFPQASIIRSTLIIASVATWG